MVITVLAAAWCLAAVLTLGLDRVLRWFTPAWQVPVLGLGAITLSVATATSTLAALCVLGACWGLPVIALTALIGLGVALVSAQPVRHGLRVLRGRRAAAVFRSAPRAVADLLVIDDVVPEAFAVPGRRSLVVVTTGMRQALSPSEFGVLLQHERAHLRYRHHIPIQLAEFAARINPVFGRWCTAVRFAAERHADECAARCGRAVATRALTKAALLSAVSPDRLGVGGESGAIVRRVRALRTPQPPRQRLAPLLAAFVLLVAIGAEVEVTCDLMQDLVVPELGETALLG